MMPDSTAASPTPRIRTLVVDDEKLARSGLCAMLANDAMLAVDTCTGGREAVKVLRSTPVQLVFLDVQMPRVGGFDVIASIGAERMPVVVFTTAYDAYAIQAFEACALDYLLKPIREARLMQAVARAKEAVRQRRLGQVSDQLVSLLARHPAQSPDAPAAAQALAPLTAPLTATLTVAGAGHLRRVLLRSGTRSYYLDVADIDWIESDNYYARIWTGVRSHLLRQSLNELEAELDPHQFVRVHRSAIVNVTRVREIRQTGIARYAVVLSDRTLVPLSRTQRNRLHSALRAHTR